MSDEQQNLDLATEKADMEKKGVFGPATDEKLYPFQHKLKLLEAQLDRINGLEDAKQFKNSNYMDGVYSALYSVKPYLTEESYNISLAKLNDVSKNIEGYITDYKENRRESRKKALLYDLNTLYYTIPNTLIVQPARAVLDSVGLSSKYLDSLSEDTKAALQAEAQNDAYLTDFERGLGEGVKILGQALPYLIAAKYTGGQSLATTSSQLAASAGAKTAIQSFTVAAKNAATNLFSSPSFWMSAIPSGAQTYFDAKEAGASLAERSLAAVTSGLLNGTIEVGVTGSDNGMQSFMQSLRQMTTAQAGQKLLKQYVAAAMAEGLEEAEQNIASALVAKATYDKTSPLFSLDNESAVLNPLREAKSFLIGTAVGGLLTAPSAIKTGAAVRSITQNNAQQPPAPLQQTPAPDVSVNEDVQSTAQENPLQSAGTDNAAGAYPSVKNQNVAPMEIPAIVEDPSLTKKQRQEKLQSDVRESARKFGIHDDVANAVSYIAGRTGTHILFVDQVTMPDGSPAAGKFIRGQNLLLISKDAEAPVYEVVKHELTHSIAGTELYGKLVDFVKNSPQIRRLLDANGIHFEDIVEAKMAEYASRDEQLDYDGAVEEIVAEYVAKYMLTDQATINELFKAQQNVFYKFLFNIRNWMKNARTPNDLRELRRAEQLYVKALSQKGKQYYKSRFATQQQTDVSEKYSFHTSQNGTANDALQPYSQEMKGYIQNKGDYIVDSFEKLQEIVDLAFDEPTHKATAFFGIVNAQTLERIKSNIPNLPKDGGGMLFKTGKDYSVAITLDSIRHIKDEKTLSRKDIIDYLDKLADTIIDFDSVTFDYYYRGKLKTPGLLFKKRFSDGTLRSYELISQKSRSLVVQSLYLEKSDYKKKKSAETLLMQNASAYTPKTQVGQTSPDPSIAEMPPSVNTQYMQDDGQYSMSTGEDFETEMARLVEQYGRHKQGVNADRDIAIPVSTDGETRVRKTAQSIAETRSAMPDEMIAEYHRSILNDAMSYTPKTNRGELSFANAKLDELGFDGALEYWRSKQQDDMSAGGNIKALGAVLIKEAARRKDVNAVMELSIGIALDNTNAAQSLQASILIKNATPEGKAYSLQKLVDRLNAQNSKKSKTADTQKYADDLHKRIRDAQKRGAHQSVIEALQKELNAIDGSLYLPKSVIENIMAQTTPEGLEQAFHDALVTIAQQKTATWAQKWNQWRYMAMLSNPRTHIRNIFANVIFAPVVQTKNIVKFGLETVFHNQLDHRTTSLGNHYVIQGRYREFVNRDYEHVREVVAGGGKHNPSDIIRDNQRIFKWKALEWWRKKNSKWLEAEDAVALRFHYTRAMAQYLAGNDVDVDTITPETLGKAREYAIKEAQKATFRDESAIANFLSKLSQENIATELLIEGIVPYKKTPVNVVKRGLEYSPAGFVEAAIDLGKFKKGDPDITLNDVLDKVASGLTGTMIMGLGMILAHCGVLRGQGSDKEKEKDWDKLQGEQNYSINLSDGSYTIDWMAPAALPLFVGAELYNALSQDGLSLGEMTEALTKITDPIVELSMLQGVQNAVESMQYGGNVFSLFGSVGISYANQAIPAIGGQIARVVDDTRRQNYVEDGSSWASLQYSAQQAMGKVPGLENKKKEYVNAWGETESTGNIVERIFENLLSPGYFSKKRDSKVDRELSLLYESTKDSRVLPSAETKSFSVTQSGKEYVLSAQESTTYQKKYGSISYDILKKITASSAYEKMDNEQRVSAVGKVYDYAKEYAKKAIVTQRGDEYKLSSSAEKINTVISGDKEIADYLLFSYWNGDFLGEKDAKGNTISGSKKRKIYQAAKEAGYSHKEINYFMKILGYSTASYY